VHAFWVPYLDYKMDAVAIGLTVRFLRASGQARDDAEGAHLAAYNAYLRALSDAGDERDHRTVPGQHRDTGRTAHL
jgi:hypothetical protein